jgi:hypothetical protein
MAVVYYEEKIMTRKIANGVQLTQQCWRALKRNPQLMFFPFLSSITLVIISFLLLFTMTGGGFLLKDIPVFRENSTVSAYIIIFITLCLFYFLSYTVLIFSNTALVGVSLKLLKGESASVCDGIGIALSCLGQIISFALISATIGILAQAIRDVAERDSEDELQDGDVDAHDIAAHGVSTLSIFMDNLKWAWSVGVFFAIPVYVVENLGSIASIRRSWDIFKETWGESFTGKAVIGGVGCLVKLVILAIIVALIAIAAATNSVTPVGIAILFGIVSFIILALFQGAINGVFQASLYQYATTGDSGRFIDNDLARNAFPE